MPAYVLSAVSVPCSQIRNFPSSFLRPLRRADDLTRVAALSAVEAVEQCPVAGSELKGEKGGVFVGTGFGPLETNFRFLDSLRENGEAQASPTLFSHSVHNTVAGYISRILDIRGPGLTLNNLTWSFLWAMSEALSAIESGMVRCALVIAVEIRSPFLEDAYSKMTGNPPDAWEYGAVSWLLGSAPLGDEHPICKLHGVEVSERPFSAREILARASERWSQGGENLKGPMGYAFALTESLYLLHRNVPDIISWEVDAAFGHATVDLSEA